MINQTEPTMKVASPLASARNDVSLSSGDEGGLELGRFVAAIRRRLSLVLGITVAVMLLAQFKALRDKPVYSAGFEILTRSVTVESEVISSVPDTLTSRQQDNSSNTSGELDATKIQVLQSPTLLQPIVDQLKLKYPELDYATLAQNLSIKASATSKDILTVSFSNENAALVKDVMKTLSAVYLKYSLEERQRDIQQGISFVNDQLPQLEARVASQQSKLQRFRQQYNLIDPELQAKQLSEQASGLSQQRLDAQTQLDEARLLYSEIQQQLSRQPVENASASALNDSSRYQKLLDQLLEVDTKLSQDSALYLNSSAEIQVLQDQRRNLIPLIQREAVQVQRSIASKIRELENRNQALDQSITAVNQQVKQLSAITREYTDIQRELQIATENLNQFLAKREALRIDASQRQVPWQLLTPPDSPMPSAVSMKRNLLLGTILGLLLGLGAALIVDRLSNVIHTPKEIKDITRLPLLGVVPFDRYLNDLETIRNAAPVDASNLSDTNEESAQFQFPDALVSTPFQEAFRSLSANLRFLSPDFPIRSLVITSPTPANGKTTIATYLALAAAAMGQRVLLVDTDLRHSSLHRSLGITNGQGLTEAVSLDIDFLDLVQPIVWEENLFVLPAGSPPPDPTRILASLSMRRFMEKAKEAFDLVIYDTPPLLGLADTYLVAPQVDAVLLVVRLHQLKRFFLEQTMEELRVANVPLMGVVANASEEATLASQSYYQYYTRRNPSPSRPFLTQRSISRKVRQMAGLKSIFRRLGS